VKKVLGFFITLFFAFVSIAQQSNIKFRHLTIKDGLSQSDVLTIHQDSKGLMWFGTQDGLNVYNGFDFKVFSHDLLDSTSISNSYIHKIIEDKNGLIWLATEHGLNVFDWSSYNFKSILKAKENSKAKYNVGALVEGEKYIWVGTERELIKVDKTTFKSHKVNLMLSTDIKKLKVKKLLFIKGTKELLIATEGSGVIKYNIENDNTKQYYRDNCLLKSDIVWDIHQDSQGIVWISTNQGVNFYNPKTRRIRSEFVLDQTIGDEVVKYIYEDKSGIIWIGTEETGLYKLKTFSNIDHYLYSANNSTSLSSNKINTIYEDNTGIIWIGTQSGVDKFDKQKQYFQHYQYWPNKLNTINSNMVWSIFQDKNDDATLWVGTDKGVNIFDRITGQVQHIIPDFSMEKTQKNKSVYSIYKDHNNNIIVGTDGGAFYVNNMELEPLGGREFPQNKNRTYVITEDNKNRLWLGTKEGLVVVSEDRKNYTRITSSDTAGSLSSDIIRAITQTKNGQIWIGTDGGGLCKVLEKEGVITFKNFVADQEEFNSISNNTVLTIFEDNDGLLWLGTFGGGLNTFDPAKEKFARYTEKDGLSNNVIYGIEEDKFGNLWMSTNKGISQFIRKINRFRIFDESDGLQSNEFNNGAYFKSKTGQMFFGGINGLNAFYPEDIHINKSKPKPLITNFYLFNKPVKIREDQFLKKHISELDEIVLKHRQNVISFEFASLHYSYPLKNQHKYKLENFNEEWVDIGNNRRANYTNLDPGEYIFKVKVSNNDGIWSDDIAQIKVIVEPPFWRTIWFILIFYIITPLLLIYAIVRYRINQVKRQKELLEIQVRERTHEVIKQKELLEKEKEKAETLLLNILPSETAEELKAKGKATARQYRMTSIMFTDFKSFTKIAENIPAQDLVAELDNYFKKFDAIIEKYDVEKIKTIGDAYMCAGGIPIRNKSNPIDIVLAGLEIQRFMTTYNSSKSKKGGKGWGLRIGIHTGSVIAGVVGIKRFAYDIWGDSVNIASRIEAASKIGKVNISGVTYEFVKEFFTCEYRGKIKAKNKGNIDMYYVHSIKPELSINGEGIIPNDLFQKYVDLHIYSGIHYRKAEKYIVERLKKELPENLHYHDLRHTTDVCAAVERLALMEGIEGDDIFLLKTAALYHDSGFVHQYINNEDIGANLAQEVLPRFGYTQDQIETICSLIQATKVPQKPKNHLEQIICDADLDYLGGDEFHITADKLKRELKERDIIQTDKQWDELQVKFLEAHTYFTKTAIELRRPNKLARLEEIKEKLLTYDY
jgi:ligand-binding sensor domain-containing protein/class 3 adenylate cyclase/predicted metal-dependent HD superfamily phosphohydrolase